MSALPLIAERECEAQGDSRRKTPTLRFVFLDFPADRIPNFYEFLSPLSLPDKLSWRRDLNPRPSDYKSDALPLSYASAAVP